MKLRKDFDEIHTSLMTCVPFPSMYRLGELQMEEQHCISQVTLEQKGRTNNAHDVAHVTQT